MKKYFISLGFLSLFFTVSVMAQPLQPTDDFDMTVKNDQGEQKVDMDVGGMNIKAENSADGQMVDVNVEGMSVKAENASDAGMVNVQTIDGGTLSYKVYNVSQQNADAQVSGARTGDVLRYEFSIDSQSTDVTDFVTSLNIANILANAEMIDAGLGNVNGGTITFPSFTQQAPCQKMFTFFVRIKECQGEGKSISSSGHGKAVSVSLTCELAKSGPGNGVVWYIAAALIGGFMLIGFFSRRSSN